jgi:hypothetical protein
VSHLIRYKFRQGDVLTYEQETTLLLEEPDGAKYDGTTREKSVQSVTEDHDGWWTILLSITRLSSSGPLCENIPEQLCDRNVVMKMDSRGSLLDIGSGGPPPRVPAFPIEGVSPGQGWLATAATPDGGEPMGIEFYLERVDQVDGDEVAHLVTLANSTHPDGYTSQIQGTVAFSLTQGHQVSSTTVTKLVWQNGRVSHSVLELRLQSRTAG